MKGDGSGVYGDCSSASLYAISHLFRCRRRSGDGPPLGCLLKKGHSWDRPYHNHIWKEDAMVFPMADKVLTAADQKELIAKFAEVDQAVGLDVVARLVTFARSLPTITQT